ncbi:unnamed protein product [Ambrosiozyma monospora]|uniref:Unnamed protein product n=1 Tax=Ambrosiozyma monospora TaxID=43982 RepID=A0A9W6TAT9_AMBMO|nr:unnamed protein product [Ambrosiozyma monospora]
MEQHFTFGYMSASNGVAERVNLTVLSDCRTLLHSGKVHPMFWIEAMNHSNLIRNHLYSDALGDSPAGKLGLPPLDLSKLHVFGEKCVVTVKSYEKKLDTRGAVGLYLAASITIHPMDSRNSFSPSIQSESFMPKMSVCCALIPILLVIWFMFL